MRTGRLYSALLLLLLAPFAGLRAQETEPAKKPDEPAEVAAPNPEGEGDRFRFFYVSADYLVWWIKNSPMPPLVTTGTTTPTVPGALDNSIVVLGNDGIDVSPMSGVRLNAGLWLSDRQQYAFEGSYFLLEKRSQSFSIASNENGDPLIAHPIINAITGNEIVELRAFNDPLFGPLFQGSSMVIFSSRLLGAEANVAVHAYEGPNIRVDAVGGFRYLDLTETLTIQDTVAPLQAGALTFAGNAADPPASVVTFDQFHTSSKFYGPQVGGRLDWTCGRLHVNLLAKLAMGATQQQATTSGVSSLTTGILTSTTAGGLYALPSNIGRHTRNDFAIVPETGLTLGYEIRPWLEARFGYSFLYWSSVARPGKQIDRTINPTQIPTDQAFGTAVGPQRPSPGILSSDFWAQGLNFGLAFRF